MMVKVQFDGRITSDAATGPTPPATPPMPNPTHEGLVARLRELREKATPWPWQLGSHRLPGSKLNHVIDMGTPPSAPFAIAYRGDKYGPPRAVCHSDDDSSEANAALITELVNAFPLLATTIEQQAAEIEARDDALRDMLVQAEGCWLNHYGDNPEGSPVPEHIRKARALVGEVVE